MKISPNEILLVVAVSSFDADVAILRLSKFGLHAIWPHDICPTVERERDPKNVKRHAGLVKTIKLLAVSQMTLGQVTFEPNGIWSNGFRPNDFRPNGAESAGFYEVLSHSSVYPSSHFIRKLLVLFAFDVLFQEPELREEQRRKALLKSARERVREKKVDQ